MRDPLVFASVKWRLSQRRTFQVLNFIIDAGKDGVVVSHLGWKTFLGGLICCDQDFSFIIMAKSCYIININSLDVEFENTFTLMQCTRFTPNFYYFP